MPHEVSPPGGFPSGHSGLPSWHMRLEPVRCPECNAQIDVPSGSSQVRCKYCKLGFRVVHDPKTPGPGHLRPIPRKPFPVVTCLFLVAVTVVISITVVVVVVVKVASPSSPSVKYTRVEAMPSRAHMGHELVVHVELETTSSMPHVAPHVEVAARCSDQADKRDGFFMSLSNAEKGATFTDDVHLFFVPNLREAPSRCELTLTLTEGGGVERYCYDSGTTRPGACT